MIQVCEMKSPMLELEHLCSVFSLQAVRGLSEPDYTRKRRTEPDKLISAISCRFHEDLISSRTAATTLLVE